MPDQQPQPLPPEPGTTAEVSTVVPGEAADADQDGTDSLGTFESTTGFVPSFRAPIAGAAAKSRAVAPNLPAPGQHIDDFEIVQVLGAGAFATVFLARQTSLGRQVALKVSANRGSEARTLASLEHDHIVRVFSETVLQEKNLRLLCMQFVSGTTLERIIHGLASRLPETWNGQAILEILDAQSTHPAMFDPAALRDRELLMRFDFVEAVCWLGTRLAEALAHAHNQKVLHRDIKPANILLNRYGRPLLADFNVSLDPQRMCGAAGEVFGGTLGYMAPEHIDAFNPTEGTSAEAVDERSDLYSLGLVLYELLTGKLPFGAVPKTTKMGDSLRVMAAQRRGPAPSPRLLRPDVPEVLDRVVRRCLDADPAKRYQTAAELGLALKGCGEHHQMEKDLPRGGALTRATLAHPLAIGLWLMFLPHVLGSVVNISYNSVRIISNLSETQQQAFARLALGYNLIVYSFCVWLVYRLMKPVVRTWRQLSSATIPDSEEVAVVRQKVLRLPLWCVGLACLGWLPGGLLFPLGLDWRAGPIREDVFHHFLVSFTISGLIALTYSLFAVQFLVLRVLYPRLWVDAQGLRQQARAELQSLGGRLWIFQLLAGLIPLAGAMLMLSVGPDEQFTTAGYRTFRVLVMGLIVLGMVGFAAALSASNQLHQILNALIGGERHGRDQSRAGKSTWH